MKIHMLSPPNTIAIDAFSFEPCTQRTRRFPTLFNKLGYEVIYYGHAKSDVDCEVVEIVTDKQLEDIYGYSSQNTSRLSANYLESNSDDPVYVYANQKSTEEIEKRIEYGDIISIPGFGFWPLVEQFDQNKYALVETSIGYPRLTVKDFRVFQSYTHMALMCGLAGTQSPELSDAVIPNFYDATSFEYCEDKEDYCLYLGRLIESKGLDIAIQLAQVCGFKLKIAGTGMRGKYLDNYELRYEKVPENVEILGAVEPKERNKLLAKAKVLFLSPYCQGIILVTVLGLGLTFNRQELNHVSTPSKTNTGFSPSCICCLTMLTNIKELFSALLISMILFLSFVIGQYIFILSVASWCSLQVDSTPLSQSKT